MRATPSPVLASVMTSCAQSPGSSDSPPKAQHTAVRYSVLVPEKTEAPGAGFSHAASMIPATAPSTARDAARRRADRGDERIARTLPRVPEMDPGSSVGHNRPVVTTTDTEAGSGVRLDAVLRDARQLAHDAVVDEVGAPLVGEHVDFAMDAERLGTHTFQCIDPAYIGWHWAVTLARAPRAKSATVCEVVLLPGPESLVAPEWVPWSERIRPGDLGVGDVLPTQADDERLTAGATGNDELDAIVDRDDIRSMTGWEAGLTRPRVLSVYGRDGAAERWDGGEFGPAAAMAEAAPKPCATCGFLINIAGPFSRAFGVCANEFAPADGRLVSLAYGCGAHSEVLQPAADESD